MNWHDLSLTWHYVEKWAAGRPDYEAIVFEDQRITYDQFKEQVDATAKALIEIGVRRGDRVALLSMARPEFLITFMAANKIGAMWLGMSPKFTLDELRYIVSDCQPTIFITLREYQGRDLSADVTAHALSAVNAKPELCGLYHLVAAGETTWHGYASFVIEIARRHGVSIKVAADAIKAVPTSEFHTAAKRPLNSRLNCGKLNKAFDLTLPHWQTGVERMLAEILEKQA